MIRITLFTSHERLPSKFAKKDRFELIVKDYEAMSKKEQLQFDLCYIDISGLNEDIYKGLIKKIRSTYPQRPWGILDLTGNSSDPAWFFHEGAVDYLGPGCTSEGFTNQRWKRIQAYLSAKEPLGASDSAVNNHARPEERSFAGWKAMRPGMVCSFYLLYIGAEHEGALKTSLGDKRFGELQNRLLKYFSQLFSSVDALLWMQSDASFLFLIPPEIARASQVIETCLRLELNSPLVSYERLQLDFSLPLACALHYGELPFQPPGKTGTVVADSINFIFHLAHQRSEGGRIVLSEETGRVIRPELRDLFTLAAPFEGKKLLQSKRFL